MTAEQQASMGTGFGHRSTAADVLKGINLTGKNVIVTGGYSGIGIEAVKALVAAGAHVTVPARRPDKAREELAGIPGVEVGELDLADLNSVKTFADSYVASGKPLHILINNAAIMANPETRVGPNWESQFATNHLGHFALTAGLTPALKAANGSRVVSVSSTGHKLSPIVFEDIHYTSRPYQKWTAYGQAKTANSLFAVELDRRGQAHGVRAFAVHPGGIMTELQRHLPREEMIAFGWIDDTGKLNERFKTVEQGAATETWAATSPQLNGKGGLYCEDCDVAKLTQPGESRIAGVDSHAVDADAARKLWQVSVASTGLDMF
ncbi:MAG TPA: SDR family NAD(P)-dependent oxidoreductase [Hyphomonadaceae bacterium]|nr:SDR family NAD(P)-dependent oxidoreductase [Hyphomonadaceae bacterium]HPN05333.1 SDR family NAD(P)-dependent oxidoreductase [Hyphomonadaceae bacterium]